ncbi:MAG: hypothetical protein ACQEVA_23565 [Myxococcota bacterium]
MDEASARTDFEGKLSVVVHAIEPAGEDANLELLIENTTEEPVQITKSDYLLASDSADWLAARNAPDSLTVPAGSSEKATITVAMPADKINVLNVGNLRVEVPEVAADDTTSKEATKPTGKGIQRLESDPEDSE